MAANNWKALALELAAAFEQQFGSARPTIEQVKLAAAEDAADQALRDARREELRERITGQIISEYRIDWCLGRPQIVFDEEP